MAEDLTREAQKIWNALRVMVDQEIDQRTASCVRSRKMTVMSAPNGSTVGVAEPFGQTVNIPYSSALANVKVGDTVWVDWKFDNASTMVAMATGDGQIVPDYFDYNDANRNLLEARKFIQTSLSNQGDLVDPTADTVPMDYTGVGTSNYYIHVQPSTNYRLTLYDTRIESDSVSCVVAQYASNGTFISLAASGIGWRDPQGMTFVTNVNAAFLRLSLVGFPKYRWKLEQGDISTDWQPSPEDVSPYTFDPVPTINSQNPVTSGGVYSAIANIDVSDKVSKSGDTMTGTLIAPQIEATNMYATLFHGESTSTNTAKVLSKDTPIQTQGNKQMINPNDLTLDYYINASGVPTKGNGDCYSGLIPVTPGDQIYYYGIAGKTGNRRFHAYDSTGNWIRQITTIQITSVGQAYASNALTIQDGVSYVRLSFTQLDTDVMVELAPKTSYVPYAGSDSLAALKNEAGMVTVRGDASNTISDKPTGVDAFGAMALPTSASDFGQLLISANANKGVYWRSAQAFNGGWEKLADESDLNNKVSKSGDTMTGYLHMIDGGRVTVHIPTIDVTTAPSAIVNQDALSVTDVNESGIAFVRGRQSPNGNTGVEFSARRTIGGSTYFNGVTFELSPTGTRSVGVSEPSAWRDAIGAVNKAGDTMTGALLAPTMKVYDASAPMFVLQSSASDTSALGAVYENISSRTMVIRQRNTNGYVEDYFFPTNSATANKSYNILTTKEPVTAFKDMTISISLASGTWVQQSVTQFTTPTGYVRTGISIVGGSTTNIRSYVYVLTNANANWVLLYNASGSSLSGTITLRAAYILQSMSEEFTQ